MSQIIQTQQIVEPTVEIDLNSTTRTAVVGYLNAILADEFVLYTKTRNFHWNVVGPNFMSLHLFFDTQYNQLNETVDEIAERVRSIGGRPASTLAEFLALARIREEPARTLTADEMIARLLADNESVIRTIRSDLVLITKLQDAGTVDFLTALLEKHEKMAWTLRATLPLAPFVKA